MSKVSIKAIIIGGITDVVSSNILQIPLIAYITFGLIKSGVAKDQLQPALLTAMKENSLYFILGLAVGSFCSFLGGYISAKIAKHNEVLNGTLASFLCVGISFYSMFSGASQLPLWQHILYLLLSPALACFGGYVRYSQVNKLKKAA
ncbi:MAG: hypothetical protein RLY58_1039 [Pseudomonadota bacterium]|jgi:energy-converting hydrogenase Eha subunit C